MVLIFLESSYNKHLSLFGSSEETQPLLSKYKDRMELFPNFFSNFASCLCDFQPGCQDPFHRGPRCCHSASNNPPV